MGRHLTFDDRLQIEALVKAKTPVSKIATIIGCCENTIRNELKRGVVTLLDGGTWKFYESYSPDIAQDYIDFGRRDSGCPPKIGKRHDICVLLSQWIRAGNSPAVCSHLLSSNGYGITLCTNTIYSYIRKGYIPNITMDDCPEYKNRRRLKKAKVIPRRARVAAGKSIERRPKAYADRRNAGHWEMDCIIGKKQGKRQALLTLTERSTRYEIVIRLEAKTASAVVMALDELERKFGKRRFAKVFQSITCDNGSEFSDATGIERSCAGKGRRTEVFYCHPFASSERGSNERHNRMLRKYFPKGTSLFGVTQKDCDRAAAALNNYPRKVLNWATPAEMFALAFGDEKIFAKSAICS